MVFWRGKESTQGSLILLLSCTPSLSLLLCIATTLTKKKLSISLQLHLLFVKCFRNVDNKEKLGKFKEIFYNAK